MTVLCYHAVEPDWTSPLAVHPADFERQCRWLARHKEVLPLDEALELLDAKGRLPRGTCALTFDDGFASVAEHAWPVLARYRLPATVFLVAQTLAPGGKEVDWVDTPPDHPMRTLDRETVLAMHRDGIAFGSHSWQHADLRTLGAEVCEADLRRSRELLEELLGVPVLALAHPRGFHDGVVRDAARRAGYRWALALPEGREAVTPWSVPRVGIHPGNGLITLRIKTSRGYLRARTAPSYQLARGLLPGLG